MNGDYKQLSSRQMRAYGWTLAETRHPGEPSVCKSCGQEIEWWISPKKKSVPFDPAPRDDQPRTCHFDSCGDKSAKPARTSGVYPASQIPALMEIKKSIVKEYQDECEGDMNYKDPEHKYNWLYKKLAEARHTLAINRAKQEERR